MVTVVFSWWIFLLNAIWVVLWLLGKWWQLLNTLVIQLLDIESCVCVTNKLVHLLGCRLLLITLRTWSGRTVCGTRVHCLLSWTWVIRLGREKDTSILGPPLHCVSLSLHWVVNSISFTGHLLVGRTRMLLLPMAVCNTDRHCQLRVKDRLNKRTKKERERERKRKFSTPHGLLSECERVKKDEITRHTHTHTYRLLVACTKLSTHNGDEVVHEEHRLLQLFRHIAHFATKSGTGHHWTVHCNCWWLDSNR